MGVNYYVLKIGNKSITVFSDPWKIDIEGPDDLVQRVVDEFRRNQS